MSARPRTLPLAESLLALVLVGCGQQPSPAPTDSPPRAASSAAASAALSPAATAPPTSSPLPLSAPAATATPTPTPTQPPARPTLAPAATVLTTTKVPFTPPVACAQAAAGSTCRLTMDVVRPSTGGPWPVLVLFPGGPADPGAADYLLPFANALAGEGNVVMVGQWRQSTAYGGGFATSFQDVACAIGVARATASRYGGDARSVTAVGHSLGGWAAAVVGLTPTPFWPAAGTCNQTAGSLRPDAIVDIDGATDEPVTMEDGEPYVTQFFGGTADANPDAYAAADVLQIIKSNPAPQDPPPILLVHGTQDSVVAPAVSTALHAALLAAGYPNQLLLIPGDHTAALSSDQVVASIVGVVPSIWTPVPSPTRQD